MDQNKMIRTFNFKRAIQELNFNLKRSDYGFLSENFEFNGFINLILFRNFEDQKENLNSY